MGFCINQWSFLVATVTLLLHFGDGLPLQLKNGESERDIKMEQLITMINENLLMSESGARVSRIFYTRNATFDEEPGTLPKKVFAELLYSNGLEKMKETVPMTWEEIMSLKGPFSGTFDSKCYEVFHPDHLLSQVTLENLISSNTAAKEEVIEELKQLFCNENVKMISMHFMQTDDVISGLIILSLMNDQSLLALANVGF